MAERAFLTTNYKTLNLMYKIPLDKFSGSVSASRGHPGCCDSLYKADIIVGKHPEHPDIPPSAWTITLTIKAHDGAIREAVEPKEGPESVKKPRLVLVDWKIRTGRMGTEHDVKKDPGNGDCYWHIGPEGFKEGSGESISKLRGDLKSVEGKYRYTMIKSPGAYVLVSLTFSVEKLTTNSILKTLYESNLLADCQLICDGREFPAHRAILAAQSPVFTAMFQNEMKEKSSGICTIKDIHPDVVGALLEFVYTGELTKADGKVDALWIAADRYGMEELKQECECRLLDAVCEENAFEYLCFAKKCDLKKLKREAAKIISLGSSIKNPPKPSR